MLHIAALMMEHSGNNQKVTSFHHSIQRLPLSQAVVISFTTPIMASVMARIILHEKFKIADIGGIFLF